MISTTTTLGVCEGSEGPCTTQIPNQQATQNRKRSTFPGVVCPVLKQQQQYQVPRACLGIFPCKAQPLLLSRAVLARQDKIWPSALNYLINADCRLGTGLNCLYQPNPPSQVVTYCYYLVPLQVQSEIVVGS